MINAYGNSTILHFSGHGENGEPLDFRHVEDFYFHSAGMIAMENDGTGELQFCGKDDLMRLHKLNKPALVFLSMCYGEPIARFFCDTLSVKHVVTVRNARILDAVCPMGVFCGILDENVFLSQASRCFACQFYQALLCDGRSVRDAFNEASVRIEMDYGIEGQYLLLPADSPDHSTGITPAAISLFRDVSLRPTLVRCGAAPRIFIGRRRDMQRVRNDDIA